MSIELDLDSFLNFFKAWTPLGVFHAEYNNNSS